MRVNRFEALAVKRSAAGRAAEWQADGDGAGDIRAPKKCRGLVDDLIECDGGKIRKLHFDDWPHPFDGGANSEADNRIFADGRVEDATGKFLLQIFCGLERAAECADILPVDEDARVVAERVGLGFADGFEIGNTHKEKDE